MSANYTGIDEQIKRLPEDYQLLINQLSAKHYPIKLTKNVTTKNIILRFPSPHALEMDGLKETKSMHYAIDLTKYMEDGYSYDYGGRCLSTMLSSQCLSFCLCHLWMTEDTRTCRRRYKAS